LDFEYATEQGVEGRLWSSHSLIKERYKKLLAHYRENQPSRHVERRKLEQRYVNFIKTTQFYYKGYIQRLASHFGAMTELRRIADRLSLDTQTVDHREQVTPRVKSLIEKSCYTTLLRLGDLSRYRNELRTKNRSWEPALGYYSLAGDLCPHLGDSHNQMAVIALADVNHLNAVYHLYRAIAVEQSHPLAESNLEIEFKKISTAWEKSLSNTSGNNEATLILWFVRLHARFYTGAKFSGHDELENEVLSRVTRLLKEQAFEETFLKLILVNIAAEYFAGERVRSKPDQSFPSTFVNLCVEEGSDSKESSIESFYFFLRFNIRFFCILLQTIQPELEVEDTGEDLPRENGGQRPGRASERITAIARRVLPAIRQYSIWLVSRALIIIATVQNQSITSYIQEMWRTYASVLTKLIHVFPVKGLPIVNYLLEEDETTVGFMPFRDPSLPPECNFYAGEDGVLKPRSTDPGVERNHPNIEMKGRIRNILLCALVMLQKQDFPINLNTSTLEFTFADDALQTNFSYVDAIPSTSTSPKRVRGSLMAPESISDSGQDISCAKSIAESDSHQGWMNRMVDSIVEPPPSGHSKSNETSYGMHTHTANEVFASIGRNGYQPQINTQGMLPSLPGFGNSPFTPQPNELTRSPRRESFGLNISPRQLAKRGHQDGISSYKSTQSSAWGMTSSRPPSNSTTQEVNHILQESLTQQYMSVPISSNFSNSSSLYANTPHGEPVSRGGGWGNDNNTAAYAGASDFDRHAMLQSSIWDNNQST
jgi:hypothetical protein